MTTAVFSIVGAIYVLGVVTSAAWLKCAELPPDSAFSDGEIVKLSVLSPFLSVGVAYSWIAGHLYGSRGITLPGTKRFQEKAATEERTTSMPVNLIPCAEALRLESAKLTDEEEKIVEKILDEINDQIRNKRLMKRNGFQFVTNNTNPAAQFEVNIRLREGGYEVNCQPTQEQSRFRQGQMTHTGYMLMCIPSKEACEESSKVLSC